MASVAHTPGVYLVLVCALLELFKLVVKYGEMPSDALYPSMQTPVLTVFSIEIVFIPLALLRRADHRISPIADIKRMSEDDPNTQRSWWAKRAHSQPKAWRSSILTINTLQLRVMKRKHRFCCHTFRSNLKQVQSEKRYDSQSLKWSKHCTSTNDFNWPLSHVSFTELKCQSDLHVWIWH